MCPLKISAIGVLSAFSLFGLAARAGDSWGTLRPDGSVFAVSFPSRPLVESHDESTPQIGKMNLSTYHVVVNNVVFMLEDMTFEKNSPALKGDPDHMLSNLEDTFAQSSGAAEISGTRASIQGHPARVMMLQKQEVYFRGFAITAGNHNLIILAAAQQSDINSKDVTKFLTSFRVVNL